MKVNCKIVKKFFIVSTLFFVLSVFLSCINSISFDTEKKSSSNEVTFRGIINQGAAVPSEIEKALTSVQLDAAKSAVPVLTSEYQYFAYASADGVETKIGNFGRDEKSKVFEIGLVKGVRWTVVCGIKFNDGAPATDDNIVFKDSFPVELDDTESVMVHTFSPVPVTGGNGSIKLEMTVNSNITKVVASCLDENWIIGAGLENLEITPASSTATLDISFIASGVYEVTFKFYKADNSLAFITTQNLNVVKGMETSEWVSEGTSDLFIETDSVITFNVTEGVEKRFLASTIYVGVPPDAPLDVEALDTNSGGAYEPLATVQAALNKIATSGNASIDYRIFVSGTLNGNIELSSDLDINAQSITIEGLGENPTLKGTGSDSVIKVKTSKPVTFKNVKVTGGKADLGGGIAILHDDAIVTLDGGCIVTGNSATRGGGISVGGHESSLGGKLILKDCKIYENTAHGWGGGIYCGDKTKDCNVDITGANVEIYKNTVKSYFDFDGEGAGIAVDNHGTVTMSAGKIYENTASRVGGGIRVLSTYSALIMTGGEIYNNEAKYGGGVGNNVKNEPSGGKTYGLTLKGGKIYNNKATEKGGAVFNEGKFQIEGNPSIPYDSTAAEKNDVYLDLTSGEIIKITGKLNRSDTKPIATIMPISYSRGKTLVEADGVHVTDLTPYKDFFAVKNTDWNIKVSSDKTQLVLDTPIYVKAGGSSSATGTKTDPFDTIANACSVMNDSSVNYTIYVDGEVKRTGGQTLPDTVTTSNANSITITGANELSAGGIHTDILDANGSDSSLKIYTAVPVKITNLKITGGSSSIGGGIKLSAGELTLGDDVLIEGNSASGYGGIYVDSTASLKVYGNVVVSGNTSGGELSNVFLPAGKTITVVGTLTNSKDSTKKAKICVSTQAAPTLEEAVVFTSDYGYSVGGFNAGVAPETYFRGDKWGVTSGTGDSAGEAVLAASGGQIIIEPLFEDITIKADKTSFSKSAASKVMTFSASGKDGDDEVPLTIGSGTGKVSLSYALYYHGEAVPQTQGSTTYYSTGTNTFTLGSALPVGDYIVAVTAGYKDRTYSASFPVVIKDYVGSKKATQAKEVGDIVFNDGSAMPYTEYASLDVDEKNEIKTKAIALIFYKGTGLNSGSDTTTERTLGVGLGYSDNRPLICTEDANGRFSNVTTIHCDVGGLGHDTSTFDSYDSYFDRNGSDNLEQIAVFLGSDDDTSVEEKYPAFYWAKNYKNYVLPGESSSRIKAGSEFETGWYLPSVAELVHLYRNGMKNGVEVDLCTACVELGGKDFNDVVFWSSTPNNQTIDSITGVVLNRNPELVYWQFRNATDADMACNVLPIREF